MSDVNVRFTLLKIEIKIVNTVVAVTDIKMFNSELLYIY